MKIKGECYKWIIKKKSESSQKLEWYVWISVSSIGKVSVGFYSKEKKKIDG